MHIAKHLQLTSVLHTEVRHKKCGLQWKKPQAETEHLVPRNVQKKILICHFFCVLCALATVSKYFPCLLNFSSLPFFSNSQHFPFVYIILSLLVIVNDLCILCLHSVQLCRWFCLTPRLYVCVCVCNIYEFWFDLSPTMIAASSFMHRLLI